MNMGVQLNLFILRSHLNRLTTQLLNILTYQKYPVAYILLLTTLTTLAALFIPSTWPLVSAQHKLAMLTSLASTYTTLYLCHTRGPPNQHHIITHSTHASHSTRYTPDYKLHHPNRPCRTCTWTRPARSKHCSVCDRCIARADHHCVWIGNCVGSGNYGWYLLLLVSLTGMLWYAAFLAWVTYNASVGVDFDGDGDVEVKGRGGSVMGMGVMAMPETRIAPFTSTDMSSMSGVSVDWDWGDVSRTLLHNTSPSSSSSASKVRSTIGLLALLTSLFPARLLAFHLRLIRKGMTTYEAGKWRDWAREVRDGNVWYASILTNSSSSKWDLVGKDSGKGSGRDRDRDGGSDSGDEDLDSTNNDNKASKSKLSVHAEVTPPHQPQRQRQRQFCVITEDGLPPRCLSADIIALVGEEPQWRRCRDISEIPHDYDRGFWRNFGDLVFD